MVEQVVAQGETEVIFLAAGGEVAEDGQRIDRPGAAVLRTVVDARIDGRAFDEQVAVGGDIQRTVAGGEVGVEGIGKGIVADRHGAFQHEVAELFFDQLVDQLGCHFLDQVADDRSDQFFQPFVEARGQAGEFDLDALQVDGDVDQFDQQAVGRRFVIDGQHCADFQRIGREGDVGRSRKRFLTAAAGAGAAGHFD